MAADSVLLQASIDALAIPGVVIGCRLITPGDELALLPDERGAFAASVDKVKRASGAARIVARSLMTRMGHPQQAIPKGPSGAPQWPPGLVGSLAHCSDAAVAALALRSQITGIGIDVEPAQPLDADLIDMVATETERRTIAQDALGGRLLFAIKEAVYKCVNPLDGAFLEHHDVEVDLNAGTATTRTGKRVQVRYSRSSHIVTVALT